MLTQQEGMTAGGYVIVAESPCDPHAELGEQREQKRRKQGLVELTDPHGRVHLYAFAPFSPKRHARKGHPWSRTYRHGARLLPPASATTARA